MIFLIGIVSAVSWTTPSDVFNNFNWGSDTSYTTYGGIDFTYGSGDQAIAYIKPRTNSEFNTYLLFGVSSASGIADIMALDGITGNVGIGTTSPNSKLQVAGDIHLQNDSDKLYLGQAKDVSMEMNGSTFNILNEVSSIIFNFQSFLKYVFDSDVEVQGDLNVTGNYNQGANIGYTGTCINTTYSGGIAISCND